MAKIELLQFKEYQITVSYEDIEDYICITNIAVLNRIIRECGCYSKLVRNRSFGILINMGRNI